MNTFIINNMSNIARDNDDDDDTCSNIPHGWIEKIIDYRCPLWRKESGALIHRNKHHAIINEDTVIVCNSCNYAIRKYNKKPLIVNSRLRANIKRKRNEHNESALRPKSKQKICHDSEDNIVECCICFNPIIQKIALVPCGHTKFCEDCIKKLKKICPICIQEYQCYIKLFI